MPIPQELSQSAVAAQIGTLALSQVRVDSPMAPVRAAAWFNHLTRLGIHLPLFVVRDLGLMFTSPKGAAGWTLEPDPAFASIELSSSRQQLDQYVALLERIGESEVVARAAGWRLRDEIVSILLVRSLGDIYHRWRDPTKAVGTAELPIELGTYADLDLAELFSRFEREQVWGFLQHLNRNALHALTCVELIDMETVRLLGLFREDSLQSPERLGDAVDLVDLVAALGSPEANDVASFSLDLLPSVLETKRSSGAQTFAVDGYASLERKGNIDSLVLSELAYDQDIFEQKVVDQELLFYGHERQRSDEKRLHYILVDSSASMRGRRRVFARGLALALTKKLTLQGDEVWFRFFDSRLHELVRAPRGGDFPVPYLLSFKSERGRHYAKVFQHMLLELSTLHREQGRNVVVYIVTHGQCHIPPELVSAMAQHALLYGIIILPSSELSLDFLPFLHRHQIVDATVFESRTDRRKRALDILDDAASKVASEPERARTAEASRA